MAQFYTTDPIFRVNARSCNGVSPGYWATAGSGLTLNLSGGTSFNGGAVANYAGGTLAMADNTTNYIYLNTSSSNVPATKTTVFTASDIPIATVTTSGGAITAIVDVRTEFIAPTASGGTNAGGVNVQTVSYLAAGTDSGKLVVMNSSSPTTLTLPAAPPSGTWWIGASSIGTGAVTVSPNSLLIDGGSGSLTLQQFQGFFIFTDGSNYFTDRGGVSGSVNVRGTVSFTTSSIAANGNQTGTVALGKSSLLYQSVTNAFSRLRLYSTAAGQTADLGRVIGGTVAPTVGLLAELVQDTNATLSLLLQPSAICENMDATPVSNIYWTLNNLTGGSQVFTVSLTRLVLE